MLCMICCSLVNGHRLTARLYLSSVVLSNCLRCCDSGEDGGLVTDQGTQAGDIPPGEQIHPGPGGEKCSAALLLSCRWMELSVLSRGVSGRGYSPTVPGLRCWRLHAASLYKGRNRKTEERERERNKSCPIKHFFSPSRAHLTSHHPAVLLPWAQALTHLYVFPSDLSTSFLSAPVNHELMYEGNF